MKKILFLLLLSPLSGKAHPGVGIVRDSKGTIYYTDLRQVWKISAGKRSLVVPDVHTHELWVDKNDDLYGEGNEYDAQANKFYHYLWRYQADGRLDTVIGRKEAYVTHDFTLARDKQGNEYYLKRFLLPHTDTSTLYRKNVAGKEIIFATGNFRTVNWLHPQDDGSLLFASKNDIYTIDPQGQIQIVTSRVAPEKPTFKLSTGSTIWGVWRDQLNSIYAAVLSDQSIRKIDPGGKISVVYRSEGNWTPLHGLFDKAGRLWVLESSDQNEIRVTLAPTQPLPVRTNQIPWLVFLCAGGLFLLSVGLYLTFHKAYSGSSKLRFRSLAKFR